MPDVIAIGLSLSGRKCCFLTNAPCSSLYLATCTLGGRFDKKYVVATMKSCHDAAGLYFISPHTAMNGSKYTELLKEKLKLHVLVHSCTSFMQGGAPCHCSKVATDFLKKNKISVLEWPGNSPDLTPIEYVWTSMTDGGACKQPSSAENLMQESWGTEITHEHCDSLVSSIPHRIQAVIYSKGGYTKY